MRFDAATEETVDLSIEGVEQPSEHHRLQHALNPLLEGVGLAEVADDEMDFLEHEIGDTRGCSKATGARSSTRDNNTVLGVNAICAGSRT